MSYEIVGGADKQKLGAGLVASFGGLGARSSESAREYLLLEIEQQKVNLRHAELRLKQHDEYQAERKGQEAQAARSSVNRNLSNSYADEVGDQISQVAQAK